MRKILAFSILTLMLLASPLASSIPFSTVGSVDTIIASATLPNSGDATELNWVKDVLGNDSLTLVDKYDSVAGDWELVTGGAPNIFAADLGSDPAYFILKFGHGGVPYDSHYLFGNVAELAYAVIDFSLIDVESLSNFSIDRISHVDEIGGTSIPEPMGITLLGLALLAFGCYKKKSLVKQS